MAKIVYNACYGGFGLSDAGMRRYAEIKGIKLYPEQGKNYSALGLVTYWTVPPEERDEKRRASQQIYDKDIERDDPALVQVVEELGSAASDAFAALTVEDVPAGMSYRIDEYDGFESVMTVNSYDWKVARD